MLKHAHFQDWFNPGRNKFIPSTARNCPGVVTPLLGLHDVPQLDAINNGQAGWNAKKSGRNKG